MKVLVVSHLYPSSLSRTSGSFVHNQVRFLRSRCSIRVVSPTPWFPSWPGFGRWSGYGRIERHEVLDEVEVERPPYLVLPRRILFSRNWRSYLAALHRSDTTVPDLIHAHCAYPDGLAAVEYGRRVGRPVVITVHGHDIKILPRANSRWRTLVLQALQGAEMVIAVSREMGLLVERLGVTPDKIRIIPNGVDCHLFKSGSIRSPGMDGWRLLYVGRFDPAKGIGVLLEAMGHVCKNRRDIQLTLIGGNAATGTGIEFRNQAEKLGIGDCVQFIDEVPWTELPVHMNSADVFVLPSFSEGLPLVLLEAMACGLPVIATRCGGSTEIVEEETGRLVEVADVNGLAEAVEEVTQNHRNFDREVIRRRAEERYDYRIVATSILHAYEAALDGYLKS